jgi:hypothetical protein
MRGLLDIITIVSLLVAMAAAGLWGRSSAVMDLVRVHRMDWDVKHNEVPQSVRYVISLRGRLMGSGREEVPERIASHILAFCGRRGDDAGVERVSVRGLAWG